MTATTCAVNIHTSRRRSEGAWAYVTADGAEHTCRSASPQRLTLLLEAVDALLDANPNRRLRILLPDRTLLQALSRPERHRHLRDRLTRLKARADWRIRFDTGDGDVLIERARTLAHDAALVGRGTAYAGEKIDDEYVVIATDGSYLPGSGAGGWAWWVDEARHGSGSVRSAGSSHRMEVQAVLEALRAVSRTSSVLVLSDSKNLVDTMVRVAAGEQLRVAASWDGSLRQLRRELDRRTVRFQWVPGHAGVEVNERADRAARAAACAA
jgi:ribonuclease HI